MTGRISDYLTGKWLADLSTCWVALHTDNPDIAGAYASEVFGGGYGRQIGQFSFPDSRATWNTNAISFAGLPAVTLTHLCGWDSTVNGNLLWSIALDTPIRVIAGRGVSWAPETFAISLD